MKRVTDRARDQELVVGQSYPRSSRSRRAGRTELPAVFQEKELVYGRVAALGPGAGAGVGQGSLPGPGAGAGVWAG